MATPSKTPAMSTPKTTNLTPTSVRKMASPRPVTAGKSLAYKSPMAAMKTPASTHSQNISTSSQPSNTPVLAHTFTEGAVNLDSPSAALMGFSNSHGLTPLPSGLDGLGLQTAPSRHVAEVLPRNSEAEKIQRLQDTVSLLKTRVTGRGVTRDGVVRIAQLSGFTTYWDEDLLTVAGTCVDLEIMFDSDQKGTVKDVVLKISASGSENRQEEASEILNKDLAQRPTDTRHGPWNMLSNFADNLDRLRQLDKLSNGINCFEAVDGVYQAFKQVWEEEKKRLTWRSDLHHLCSGTVGRVRMNTRQRLGVTVEYWTERHELDDSQVNSTSTVAELHTDAPTLDQETCWTALISCEAGFPSLKVSREWLLSEILITDEATEDTLDGIAPLRPAWKVQDLPDDSGSKQEDDLMKNDGDYPSVPPIHNIHFTFTLDPVLYLPTNVFESFEERGLLLSTNQPHAAGYRQILGFDLSSGRWLRSLVTYNSEGAEKTCDHSYWLSTSELSYVPVTTVGFAHPRQLADLLPVLRQHALLWSILHKLRGKVGAEAETARTPESSYEPGQKIKANTVQKRSKIARRVKLDSLLAPARGQKSTPKTLPIDITLGFTGVLSSARPKLEVIVPVEKTRSGTSRQECFCSAVFEIEENGTLLMDSVIVPGTDPEKAKVLAGRVLMLSEDIGVLVEWMLDQVDN